jgi:acetyl esterase
MSARRQFRANWRIDNIRTLRARYERACRVAPQGAYEWRLIDAGDRRIRVLVHDPERRGDRAIFYFHGGGWIVGSPSTHADVSGALAVATGLPVISIDYRLAPEHKAEAAIADGLAVIAHYLGKGGKFATGILAGDSAGGSIALAAAHRTRNMSLNIAGVLSFYGAFGLAANPGLHGAASVRAGLDATSMRRYWLAANASAGISPYSVPALAHADGPPVYLLAAGLDPVRDDTIALARALGEKGRSVTIDLLPFVDHSFLQAPHARHAKQIAFRNITRWITALA